MIPFLALSAHASGWTTTRLDLDLTVADGTLTGTGTATVRFDGDTSPGPRLALGTRGPVLRFTELARTDGPATVRFSDDGPTRLGRLDLPEPAARGDTVEVSFAWERTGDSVQLVVTDRIALASWVEGWFPVAVDDAFTAAIASAPGTTRIRLPPGWRSASNGTLVERVETADGTVDTWDVTVPVARSFVAAPYDVGQHEIDGRSIGVYLLSSDPESAAAQADTLALALSAMEDRFGPYPYPSYAIAEVPEDTVSWYASSEQGFIMAATSAFDTAGGNVPLFAHEAAHGWWGNLVNTTGPGEMLASESLAQYGAVVAIEALEGVGARNTFLRFSREGYNPRQCARGYFEIRAGGGDRPLSRLSDGRDDHNLSDSKGMWVYHMLRLRIGDERFFGTLRSLLDRFAGRELSLDDIRAAFVAAAPDADLETFFAQWLDRTGAPVLDVDWWAVDGGTEVRITQRQGGAPFRLALPIGIATEDGVVTQIVDLRDRHQVFRVESGRPLDVRLDPDDTLLLWRPEYGPPPR